MNSFYAELKNCKFKPIALSLVPPFAESFVLKSREIPTVQDLSDPKYQDLEYPRTPAGLFGKRNRTFRGAKTADWRRHKKPVTGS